MVPTNSPYKKDQLAEQYGAIGPASLVAALMAARNRSNRQQLHVSYLPSEQALRPQQTAEQAQRNHPHDNADQAIENAPGKGLGKNRLQ